MGSSLDSQEPGHNAGHMQKRLVVDNCLLIARRNPTIVLDSSEKPLNFVALLVQLSIMRAGFFSALPARNHSCGLQRRDLSHEGVTVIALVAEHGFDLRALPRAECALLYQRRSLGDLMALARRDGEGQRIAQRVGDDIDFSGKPASAAA